MDKNIAVFGDNESIKGFSAVGFDIFSCDSEEEIPQRFKKIADSGRYAVIYVTEEYFALLGKELKRYEARLSPAIVPIPGIKGNNGAGIRRLSGFVERAVGSDIIFNN